MSFLVSKLQTCYAIICRLSSNDNPFRCSYILPDGITYKKGFVKDLDEACRYSSLPANGESIRKDSSDSDRSKFEDKKKPELSQNVTSRAIITCLILFGII